MGREEIPTHKLYEPNDRYFPNLQRILRCEPQKVTKRSVQMMPIC